MTSKAQKSEETDEKEAVKARMINYIEDSEGPAEFEIAVSALEFGKFNYILILLMIPSLISIMYETSLISYITPVAQCDLNLTLNDKGILNAITYVGPSGVKLVTRMQLYDIMKQRSDYNINEKLDYFEEFFLNKENYPGAISGAIIWGFLIDTLGRKKLLSSGYLIEGLVVLITAFSQDMIFLLILKLIGGAMVGGLYIAFCTYISEFHSTAHRGKIQMTMGFIAASALVFIPLLAAFLLPLNFKVTLFNGYLQFHAWNLYIAITSIVSLVAGTGFIFLPESPKFLMTKGNNEEALKIFKKVYTINTGHPEDNYPVMKLICETNEQISSENEKPSCTEYMKNGWHQIAPLFGKQYISKLVLATVIQTIFILVANTLRGWLPQIFQSVHEYQAEHNVTTTELCVMLEGLTNKDNLNAADDICSVNLENNFSVYLNSMINAFVCMGGYLMAGTLINILGRKTLLAILGTITGITIMTTYFSENTATTLVLTSLALAACGVCFDVVMTTVVVMFPTTLRAMAISVTLLVGRSGAIVGNIVFPQLLQLGCAPPFLALGGLALGSTILCFLLPNTDKDSLK